MNAMILKRQGWTLWHAVGAAAFLMLAVFVTWEQWSRIVTIAFRDEEQSHIFLVPIVATWMFWARRVRVRNCPPSGMFIGPVLVAIGTVAMLIGHRQNIQTFRLGGTVIVALGAVLSWLGTNVLRRFLPAFIVLVFLVPIPNSVRTPLSGRLEVYAASSTQIILQTFGVDVEQSGNLLNINGFPVNIAEACNGMRMVFALVLVTYAFAYGMPLRNGVRLTVLALSPIVALVCNILRLVPTVLIYGQSDKTFLGHSVKDIAKTFHDVSGWVMVPLAFLLLLGCLKLVRWALIPVTRYTLAYQ